MSKNPDDWARWYEEFENEDNSTNEDSEDSINQDYQSIEIPSTAHESIQNAQLTEVPNENEKIYQNPQPTEVPITIDINEVDGILPGVYYLDVDTTIVLNSIPVSKLCESGKFTEVENKCLLLAN